MKSIFEQAEELWDEFSFHLDDDLDSLQQVSGGAVMKRLDFIGAVQKITPSPQDMWVPVESGLFPTERDKSNNDFSIPILAFGAGKNEHYGLAYYDFEELKWRIYGTYISVNEVTHWRYITPPTSSINPLIVKYLKVVKTLREIEGLTLGWDDRDHPSNIDNIHKIATEALK